MTDSLSPPAISQEHIASGNKILPVHAGFTLGPNHTTFWSPWTCSADPGVWSWGSLGLSSSAPSHPSSQALPSTIPICPFQHPLCSFLPTGTGISAFALHRGLPSWQSSTSADKQVTFLQSQTMLLSSENLNVCVTVSQIHRLPSEPHGGIWAPLPKAHLLSQAYLSLALQPLKRPPCQSPSQARFCLPSVLPSPVMHFMIFPSASLMIIKSVPGRFQQSQGCDRRGKKKRFTSKIFFFAVPLGKWDLSSPTRDWTCVPYIGSTES